MDDDSNWVKARSSIVWLLAIGVSFGAVWWIERESGKELIARQGAAAVAAPVRVSELPASPDLPAVPAPHPLTDPEKQWARIAWTYFEKNTDATQAVKMITTEIGVREIICLTRPASSAA